MKNAFLLLLLIIAFQAKAQVQQYEFFKGLTFDSSKDEAIEVTVKLLRNYFITDVGEIRKRLRKEKSIKLNDKNINPFLDKMEKDIRAELKRKDDWSEVKLEDKYIVTLPSVLGRQAYMIGLGYAGSGKLTSGRLYLKFSNNKMIYANVYVKTTYLETLFSGHSYGESYISEKQQTLSKMLGTLTRETRTGETWRCSSRGNKVYYVNYNFNDSGFYGGVYHTYDILVKSTGVNECAANGNHLTEASFIIQREVANEVDFKERT